MWRSVFLVFIILNVGAPLVASRFVIDESIELIPNQLRYELSHQHIVVNSEEVFSDSLRLMPGSDYTLDYRTGILELAILPPGSQLKISYFIIPPEFTQSIQLYQRSLLTDSLKVVSPRVRNNWFDQSTNLNISGSKTFALSFSESGEADLLQSLYVNLSGELAKDVQISAQLSDSQSKLSPEGDSKELSSLDQVFIRIYGKKWELGMGDLELSYENSRFLNYQTKIEGLQGSYNGNHNFQAAFSAGTGKRAFMQIPIVDGKQGPYFLIANDAQRSFIIVAGSEEIYLDGTLQERGQDYYIDYAEGSVMFRRLVSSSNIVNAWFQYSDENYQQSTYFNSSTIRISDQLSISHHLIHQTDNKNHPLLYSFTEADLDSLATAGDGQALSDGVIETEAGNYIQVIDPEGLIYYEYAPGDSSAIYNVIFSYMGPGKGDYEEFSSGIFRWVGPGNGSWLPVKKIIAPAARSNIEFGLHWENGIWQSGADMMYAYNDQNTLSSLDDNDNSAGIAAFWLAHQNQESPLHGKLEAQYRFADTYRFGTDGAPEHDFSALPAADSLAMGNIDLNLSYETAWWKPELLLRYRELKQRYIQKALRFSSESKAYSILPQIRLKSTISDQSGKQNSLLMYHDAELGWAYSIFGLKLAGIYSLLDDEAPQTPSTRYLKWQPSFSIQSPGQQTLLIFTRDQNSIKQESWQEVNSSDTYALKHHSNFENHSFDLDFSHRELINPNSDTAPVSSYELLNLRSSHNIMEGAINFYNNYELNQSEFFPRIRDLIYVGPGLGIYDSTGVAIEDGEYIYEYVSSPDGRLSTEITAALSMYLKPGLHFQAPLWKKIQSDIFVTATEQAEQMNDWRSYLFLPDYTYSEQSIYGRQAYLQNFWLDLYQSRIISNVSVDISRSIDNRYQAQTRSFDNKQAAQIDFRDFFSLNTRLSFENSFSRESRYASEIYGQSLSSNFEKIISPQHTVLLELKAFREEGKSQIAEESYSLQGLALSPQVRSVLMQKYRVSARFNLGYNFREGSSYLLFLPQKREGFVSDGTLSAIYRMNSFSTFSLEYRYSKFPEAKSTHNLKLEFKAEL